VTPRPRAFPRSSRIPSRARRAQDHGSRASGLLSFAKSGPRYGGPLWSSAEVYASLKDELELLRPRNTFFALALDGKNRLVGVETVSTGTLTASLIHPRVCAGST